MIFQRKEILNILSFHQGNIDKKAINPIFSSIRFFSENGVLKISSMDGERLLEHSISYNENIAFDMFLPGYNLYELLKKSSCENFEIKDEAENYLIKLNEAEFKFSKYSHKSYPNWVDDYNSTIEVDSEKFNQALKNVRWACSNDESRPFLNGVCIDIKNGIMNVCATDGLRLALVKIANIKIEGTWIISKKSVNDLTKLLDEASGVLKINIGKNAKLEFQNKDSKIIWRTLLVFGKFPNYEKIIPSNFTGTLTFEIDNFISKLDRLMIIANFNQPVINLNLSTRMLYITSESSISSGKDLLIAEYEGPDFKTSFNARLLLEMLNNMKGKVQMFITNPHTPVLMKKIGMEDELFILAPVKRD